MTTAPYDLRIDAGGDAFLTSGPTPCLSWRPPAKGGSFPSTRIEAVIGGGIPQTRTAEGSGTYWPFPALTSGQRVRWRVQAHDSDTASAWSDWHAFEAGLFAEDWTARWITPPAADFTIPAGQRPGHELYATFPLVELPPRARLYATATGVYEAFLNGQRIGNSELTPGTTSYDETLYAQAYDVTALLQPGENCLVFVLTDGWFWGQVGAHRSEGSWGEVLGVRAELHLGPTTKLITDETWQARTSNITRASLMEGQTTDLRLDPSATPSAPVLLDQVLAPAPSWSPAPPTRVVQRLSPRVITERAPGEWVIDFGQNASGWLRLSDLGPAGTLTTIDYGEYVGPDGDLDTTHLDSVRPGEDTCVFIQRDEVISDGTDGVFEPRHTVHGFRYARLRRDGAPLDPASIQMQVVHTDLVPTGAFECSDDDLNKLHEITRWSFLGNAVDVPTDCPTRERLGWTGDYQVFAPTATRLFDVLGFTRKWLQSVRDDQLPDGRIASFSPDHRRLKTNLAQQMAMMAGSAGWADAIVYVPWEMYRAYGSVATLGENWQAMTRFVDWAAETAATKRHHTRRERSADPAPHEQFIWDGSFHWGEWLEPVSKAAGGTRVGAMQTNPSVWFMADKGEVGTAYLHRSAATCAKIAEALGRPEDAARYATLAENTRDAWCTEFLAADGRTATDTQAAYVRALAFGLIPDRLREAAAARLVELIRANDTHLSTGFLSTAFLLPVLVDAGHTDLAYELLLRRTPPSWLYMIDHDATTIWEDWEGIDEQGAHDSLNHYSKGAVAEFLHTHVLGLRQAEDSVAWTQAIIVPVPGGGLTWAKGEHLTPQGLIRVEWQQAAGELTVNVELPPATEATVIFPDGTGMPVTGPAWRGSIRNRTP
ncbi:MAG: glycoside hydrolase family 78 protein [Promicromonosporaceae bacterium]|nr:glycoside hydrolase family 78 protein [Promicromonosporaceae bacterium]